MKSLFFASAALAVGVVAAGCAPRAAAPVEPTAPVAEACADGGPRLGATGLCRSEATTFIAAEVMAKAYDLPEGCSWVVNDVALPDQAILYLAAQCGERTTQLEFAGGAQSAALYPVTSGLYDVLPAYEGGDEPVRLWLAESYAAGLERILNLVRETTTDPAEAAACELRSSGNAYYPADALVVDVNAAFRASKGIPAWDKVEEGELWCGPFGYTNEAGQFWRVGQGYAWWFNFGQDGIDFRPDSMTVLNKGADGTWAKVAP
jgi:hypothetical protein